MALELLAQRLIEKAFCPARTSETFHHEDEFPSSEKWSPSPQPLKAVLSSTIVTKGTYMK